MKYFSVITDVIRRVNAQGIRIPKQLLALTGIEGEICLPVKQGKIVISQPTRPRQGWEAAFKEMAESGDDALVLGDNLLESDWDTL